VFNEKPPAVKQKFASSIDQPITVRVCYRYTFNMQKNVNKMQGNHGVRYSSTHLFSHLSIHLSIHHISGLPCSMTWHDIDIILTFDDQENFEKYYFPRYSQKILLYFIYSLLVF
jgi:hypothetical protein